MIWEKNTTSLISCCHPSFPDWQKEQPYLVLGWKIVQICKKDLFIQDSIDKSVVVAPYLYLKIKTKNSKKRRKTLDWNEQFRRPNKQPMKQKEKQNNEEPKEIYIQKYF